MKEEWKSGRVKTEGRRMMEELAVGSKYPTVGK
jgi:hypothetical protein